MFRLVIEVDKPDVKDRLEALKQAFEMGLRIRSADLRELLSLEQPGPEEEYLQHPSYGPPPAPGLAGGPGPASTQAPANPELATAEGGGPKAEGGWQTAIGGTLQAEAQGPKAKTLWQTTEPKEPHRRRRIPRPF